MITAPELEIAVLVLGMVILMAEAFAAKIDKRFFAFAGIAGLAVVLIATFFVTPTVPPDQATGFWNFYTADPLSILFKQFALLTTILVLIMMIDYAPVVESSVAGSKIYSSLGEFFALPIFTCAGLMYMASAIDFVFIFISLELVTISFYVLVSFTRRNPTTLEAGVKYLVLSALSTAFLVYGITWIFGVTGQTNLQRITVALADPNTDRGAALFGMVLVLVALGFKIAAVPFQIWVPDVYQGAPTPVTAYLSVGSKAAGFVVLLRVLRPFLILPQMQRLIVLIALLTLIYGNLAALPQGNLKRLLAYSSIAHAGYLLIGFVPGTAAGYSAVVFYLIAYLFMNLGAFGVVVALAHRGQDCERMSSFAGLAQRRPGLAALMTLFMVALAGIPGTAGFTGKFLIFAAAVDAGCVWLAILGVLMSVVSVYYYLRIPVLMYMRDPGEETPRGGLDSGEILVLTTCALGVLFLGLCPNGSLPGVGDVNLHVLDWARHSVASLIDGTHAAVR